MHMKKLAMILSLLVAVGCTNQKVVEYNTQRLDHIEAYLKNNQGIKATESLEQLQKEGKVEAMEEYKSLEREAEAWVEKREN